MLAVEKIRIFQKLAILQDWAFLPQYFSLAADTGLSDFSKKDVSAGGSGPAKLALLQLFTDFGVKSQ